MLLAGDPLHKSIAANLCTQCLTLFSSSAFRRHDKENYLGLPIHYRAYSWGHSTVHYKSSRSFRKKPSTLTFQVLHTAHFMRSMLLNSQPTYTCTWIQWQGISTEPNHACASDSIYDDKNTTLCYNSWNVCHRTHDTSSLIRSKTYALEDLLKFWRLYGPCTPWTPFAHAVSICLNLMKSVVASQNIFLGRTGVYGCYKNWALHGGFFVAPRLQHFGKAVTTSRLL